MDLSGSDSFAEKVQALGDIELAVLICLIAEQHCIIEAGQQTVEDVQEELKMVIKCRHSNT